MDLLFVKMMLFPIASQLTTSVCAFHKQKPVLDLCEGKCILQWPVGLRLQRYKELTKDRDNQSLQEH